MKAIDRQKACPNCSGKIPLDVGQCPYCFAQVPVESGKEASSKSSPFQESSKYAPPYQPKSSLTSNFLVNEEKKFFGESGSHGEEAVLDKQILKEASNKSFWPILLLSLGGNLLVLGILQFFFAEQGVVKLEMNAGYWFLFLVVSIPLLYFGLKKLKEE